MLKKEPELRRRVKALDNEISITPFKFKHMPLLIDMLESQKYPDVYNIKMKTLPKIGYIATLDGMPIAAGFLRRVEPCFAQVDTLVSNAFCGSLLRHQGIDKVVNELIREAKRLKLQGLIAHTRDMGTIARAESIGFKIVPQTILALSLQEITA